MTELKERKIDGVEFLNPALAERIILALNELDDGEFIDIINGSRGSLSKIRSGKGSFKINEPTCVLGSVENTPCQFLESGKECEGTRCDNFKFDR